MLSIVDGQTIARIKRSSGDLRGVFSLRAWQTGQIRKCVSYVRENSEFYRQRLAGVDAEKLDDACLLESLPFTFPGDILDAPEKFLCVPAKEVGRVVSLRSSGTTGQTKRIFLTGGDVERTVDFFAEGMKPIAKTSKKAAIGLPANALGGVADLLVRALERNGVSAICHGPVVDTATAALLEGCGCFVGAPVPLLKLSCAYPRLRPMSVLLSADYIPDAVMERIRENWHCEVFTHYGLTETGFGCAVQCHERKGHHIRHSEMMVEIVDPFTGSGRPYGQEGEITVTTFANAAMPLIRYRTGDIGSVDVSPCECGGTFPRLGKVRGRFCSDGINPSIQELDDIVFSDRGILDYSASLSRAQSKMSVELEAVDAPSQATVLAIESLCMRKGIYAAISHRGKASAGLPQKKRGISLID
ncbi:MAG: AMP-binding protein [Synergistaceae bacterium]|jgi:phenylacetate-coenzyme A ligase PaaK-like adenylate-forming protein|nr:AMP-binding protein [Synergistaceae bacterium]